METSRKAFTPDIVHKPLSQHHRNNSDIVTTLNFEATSPKLSPKPVATSDESSPVDSSMNIEDTPTETPLDPPIPIKDEESLVADVTVRDQADDSEGVITMETSEDVEITKKHMSIAFRQELLGIFSLKSNHSDISTEILKLSDPELDIMSLFSRRLPDVIENTMLPKREVCIIGVQVSDLFYRVSFPYCCVL